MVLPVMNEFLKFIYQPKETEIYPIMSGDSKYEHIIYPSGIRSITTKNNVEKKCETKLC
jgi:hypothetical protein